MTAPSTAPRSIWTREGAQQLGRGIVDAKTALAAAGLDWSVSLRPIRTPIYDASGKEIDSIDTPTHRATVRDDSQQVLGIVRNRYGIVQNVRAFEILDPLVQAGLAEFDNAGEFHGGQDVWVAVKFNISDPRVEDIFREDRGGDTIQPYGIFTNNHAGVRKATLSVTPIRVWCSNSLNQVVVRAGSTDAGVKIRHGRSADVRLVAAAQSLWQNVIAVHVELADAYRKLRATYLDNAMFERIVLDAVAPWPTTVSKRANIVESRVEARRAQLRHLYRAGTGQNGEETAWAAFNAVTEWTDHYAQVRGSRVQAEFDGNYGLLKKKVLHDLLEVAA